jgi:uncharacterized delta-60 repeat protein
MRIWHFSIALAVLLLVLCVSFSIRTVDAAAGDLDLAFGTGGKALMDFGRYSRPLAVALQPDAKIVVVGQVGFSDSSSDFALARLNSDGSPDNSFGNQGLVTTDISNGDRAYAVALQSDGKILVAGVTNTSYGGWEDGLHGPPNFTSPVNTDFAIVRYNPDGSVDTSFGTAGKVSTDFLGFPDAAYSIIVQADQKILVAGQASNDFNQHASFALVRYNSDGSFDDGFGSDGKVMTPFQNFADAIYAIAVQSDNKIVAVGSTFSGNNSSRFDFAAARYIADGSLDSTFGNGGKWSKDVGSNNFADEAHAVALQSNGKIVIAGYAQPYDFALTRLNTDGSIDNSFGQGVVLTDFNLREDRASGVAIQPDGRVIAFGSNTAFEPISPGQWGLARYSSDGSLDDSFGQNGKLITNVGTGGFGAIFVTGSCVLQPDGKLIAVGQFWKDSTIGGSSFGVVRYLTAASTAPQLLTEDNSEKAVALDSVTMMRDPFPVFTPFNFSADHQTRLMLFAINVDSQPGAAVVTVQAEDSQHQTVSLPVESTVAVPGFDWLSQIVVKLPDGLPAGDIYISLSQGGLTSNKALVTIKAPPPQPSPPH